jgi:hypothetical protein
MEQTIDDLPMAGAIVSPRLSLILATMRFSGSVSAQSEHTPQTTNTAWRSGDSSHPIRLGGEAGPSQSRQTGTGTVARGWGDPEGGKTIEHETGMHLRTKTESPLPGLLSSGSRVIVGDV